MAKDQCRHLGVAQSRVTACAVAVTGLNAVAQYVAELAGHHHGNYTFEVVPFNEQLHYPPQG